MEAKATITSSVLNLINNIVGAGLLSLPWCMKEATLMTGIIAAVIIAVLNAYSFVMLAWCCEYSGSFSYKKMGQEAFGTTWGVIIQVFVLCYTFGSCVSYVVLTADFLIDKDSGVFVEWADGTILTNRPFLLTALAVFVLVPLASLKSLHHLRYTSFFSVICTLYTMYLLVYKLQDKGLSHDVEYIGFPVGVWQACPILNVAFTAHYNGPRYYQELSNRSIPRFTAVVTIALLSSLLIYGAVGVCGFLTFGGDVDGDVFNNLSKSDPQAITGRLAMSFCVVFTYPLAFHSMRTSIFSLLHSSSSLESLADISPAPVTGNARASTGSGRSSGRHDNQQTPLLWNAGVDEAGGGVGVERSVHAVDYDDESGREGWWYRLSPTKQFWIVTLGMVVVTVGLGIALEKVEVVLDYKGAIFGSAIVYVFPSLMFLRLRQLHGEQRNSLLRGDEPLDLGVSKQHTTIYGGGNDYREQETGILTPLKHYTSGDRKEVAIVVWGLALGLLGTVITALTQAHALDDD